MKWRIVVFWLLVFTGLWFFFWSFGTSTFQRQEEVQLFIPEWTVVRDMLSVPGGFCRIAGQALVQYYFSSIVVLGINSAFLCLIGILCYLLLQAIAPRGYHLLLALFPVSALIKAHVSPFYVLDGTVGLFLLLLLSYGFIRIRRTKVQLLYGVVSMVLVYGLAGQLAVLYGSVVVLLNLLCRREKWYYSLVICFIGLLLTYIDIRLAIGIPLTDGIYSERYQESQMQPDSYLYYVWIRFTGLLLLLFVITFAMKVISWKRRLVKVTVSGGLFMVLFGFSAFCLPGPYEVQNNRMNELSVLERQNDWEAIIRKYAERKSTDNVSLTYLNMALAQKGLLGDRLFHYDQKGPQSLLATWDRTYDMSCLLSDIHYRLGDISLSEGYAMEGLTLAKRGGSPRMLQRLVEISLIRGEHALASKYLAILGRLPNYRRWTETYRESVRHPEALPLSRPDRLLCLIDMDSLWMEHLHEPGVNRIAWEYLGCSYLLAKEMEKFKAFLLRAGTFMEGQSLPVHFQEAALVLAVEDVAILDSISVRPEIVQHFKQFQKDILKVKNSGDGLAWLYQQYGDTFWFYYYCKKMKG